MAFDLVEEALQFIDQYGLIAVFILLVLDGAMLMPVLPGEVVMIFAVARYADDVESLAFLIVFMTAAALLGSLILYGISWKGGRPLIERFPRLFMMPRRRRERLERLFANPFGQSFVLFLRLLPLTRVLVNIPAGLARMPVARFLVLSAIGLFAFHAGFLWLAYEYRQPDSAVAARASALQEAYANPAWAYAQANTVVVAAVLIGLGIFLSLKASWTLARQPDESTGSLLGSLTTAALVFGGLALGVALWMEPGLVFDAARQGGLDMDEVSLGLPYEPLSTVALIAWASVMAGLILRSVRSSAKRRARRQRTDGQGRPPNGVTATFDVEGTGPQEPPRPPEP